MTTHPRDRMATNPRLQCACCGQWKRLNRAKRSEHGDDFNFYGGCGYTNGEHLAAKGGDNVCIDCCATECHRLACEATP